MSPTAQREFVQGLCDSIRDKMLKHIDDCNIPEEWDGLELRQLIAEVAWSERGFRFGHGGNSHQSSKRVQEYRNLVLVRNLDR